MNEIIKELRKPEFKSDIDAYVVDPLKLKAADRIEVLEKALSTLSKPPKEIAFSGTYYSWATEYALKVLKGETT